MNAQRFYEVMLSNGAMGIALALVIVALLVRQRAAISSTFEEVERVWRFGLLAATGMMSALIAWITVRDSWLQLVTDPYRLVQKFESQRTIFDPVDHDDRVVTMVLTGVAAILVAALFARFIGGYVLQVAVLMPAIIGWFAMFILRQRLDMVINTVPDDSHASLIDLAAFAGFWVLRTSLGLLSVITTFALIVLVIAPIVTLGLDVLRLRTPRTSDEATPFFGVLGSRAATYDSTPIASRWKPIRSR